MQRGFKSRVQRFLRSAGLYQRLKASRVYDLYWRVADRSILAKRKAEVDFYRGVLGGLTKGDLIFDVGANHGFKTDIFLRLGARVVAVDPDETNQRALKEKFLQFRLHRKPVVVIGKAVSDRVAVETMWIDQDGSAKNTLSAKWVETLRADEVRFGETLDFSRQRSIETTTLDSLIASHGAPFFIKVDVEGYELNVLRGLSRPVAYVSFEVNLPEFRSEGLQCVERLGCIAADGRFNFAADCGRGLVLDEWLGQQRFREVLASCGESSIEVFFKTQVAAGRG